MTRTITAAALLLSLAAFTNAYAGDPKPAAATTIAVANDTTTAEERLSHLEERLSTRPFDVHFETTTEGVLISSFAGELSVSGKNIVTLQADGKFRDQPQKLRFMSDGARMRVGITTDEATPIDLAHTLAICMTRIGISHDLALLSNARLPEHTDGTVTNWLQVQNISDGGVEKLATGPAHKITFDIVVGGTGIGSATLWIDDATNLPVRRTQTVHFSVGQMTVEEKYRW